MKEIRSIIKHYDSIKQQGRQMALATVVYVEGSSYRREGARMLIVDDGTWIGGISGGCLEGDALRKAKNAMIQDQPTIVRYDTREEDAFQIGVGLGCNGIIDVFIMPLDLEKSDNPLEILRRCLDTRSAQSLITLVATNTTDTSIGHVIPVDASMTLHEIQSNTIRTSITADIVTSQQKEKSCITHYKEADSTWTYFVEYLPPEIHIVLYGGNYDIYPLVDIAINVGWIVSVVCNPQKMDKSLFQKANVVSNKTDNIPYDSHTAAILMAHDYKTDTNNLKKVINTSIGYIGMLGPLVRSEKMFALLEKEGITIDPSSKNVIHAPVGLDTGATSPEEISISIIAEIRTFLSDRNGGFLKKRTTTIHDR